MPQLPPDSQRPDWWADLEAARSRAGRLVLVTQGTIATNPTELIEPTLGAMEFEDVFVIAAGADPTGCRTSPANARVERFVPFGPLMALVDAYVTNGGTAGPPSPWPTGCPWSAVERLRTRQKWVGAWRTRGSGST